MHSIQNVDVYYLIVRPTASLLFATDECYNVLLWCAYILFLRSYFLLVENVHSRIWTDMPGTVGILFLIVPGKPTYSANPGKYSYQPNS